MIDTYEAGVDLGAEGRFPLLAVLAMSTGDIERHHHAITLLQELGAACERE